jgi:hypothetical protein
LSAADYLELTGKYGTVIVESIPRMGLSERDQARRFITFVDGEWLVDQARESETMLTSPACYENKASYTPRVLGCVLDQGVSTWTDTDVRISPRLGLTSLSGEGCTDRYIGHGR